MSVFEDLSSKLKDALESSSYHHASEHTGGAVPPPAEGEAYGSLKDEEKVQKKEKWSEKIMDIFDGDSEKKRKEEEEERLRVAKLEQDKKEAKERVDEERGFMGKVHDVFDGGAERKKEEEAAIADVQKAYDSERRKHEDIRAKLEDAIKGSKSELKEKLDDIRNPHRERAEKGEVQKEDEKKTEHKIEELWHHAPEHEKKAQEDHEKKFDFTKIKAILTGEKTPEKKKSQRGWLSEKMNAMAGGGRASEVNEDGLDKMIDFIQEHALHQGTQSNESAAEQFKDERIANAIRTAYKEVTGHSFPIKYKH